MPRRPRAVLSGIPLHIVQRGNNRLPCFFNDDDRRRYLRLLRKRNGRKPMESARAMSTMVDTPRNAA